MSSAASKIEKSLENVEGTERLGIAEDARRDCGNRDVFNVELKALSHYVENALS